jgi:hypothetical protein
VLRSPAPTTLLAQTLFGNKLCKNAVLYICTKEPKSRIFWHPKTQKIPIAHINANVGLGRMPHQFSPKMSTPQQAGNPPHLLVCG